jgi:hypothetical protein
MTRAHRRRLLALAAALPLFAAASIAVLPPFDNEATAASTVTICLVPPGQLSNEFTLTVPAAAASALLAQTPSYTGPCAAYGTASALGQGNIRTFAQLEDGRPLSIGAVFPRTTLSGLPTTMTDGHHCYDVDGNGTTDQMTECVGGHERPLDMPAAIRNVPGIPLQWALINWNPHGHGAPGVYDVPHFDFHFYIQSKAERDAIRPGPCGLAVNCDDYARGALPVPAANMPPDYRDLGFVEYGMGNHLLDQTTPEWNGIRFTRTFIFGAYDGRISFLEPMITAAWFEQLATGQTPGGCVPIKQPQSWQVPGWYPQKYCFRYRANRNDFTVSLEDFRN